VHRGPHTQYIYITHTRTHTHTHTHTHSHAHAHLLLPTNICQVGFKPAGGIRSAKDTLTWLALMKDELGDEWTQPDLFRIGASALVTDIERQLFHHTTGRYAAGYQMPLS
jgi:deoxyribose-phosphate aldolase